MKIVHSSCGLSALSWFALLASLVACGRSPEAAAPEAAAPAASASTTSSDLATAPAAEEAAPATPSPAPAPQGLGDDSPKSKAPVRGQDEFTSLEAAERALNQAKSDLDRLALAEPSPTVGRAAPGDRANEKKSDKGAAPSAGAAANTAPSPLCENACRAFSSLTRAANAVCRLDGNSGTHCTRAKRVVSDSQHRVASCSCPTGD